MYKYRILEYTTHSETRKTLIIYEALYDLNSENTLIFARQFDIFISKVDKKKYPDSKQKYQFKLISRGWQDTRLHKFLCSSEPAIRPPQIPSRTSGGYIGTSSQIGSSMYTEKRY